MPLTAVIRKSLAAADEPSTVVLIVTGASALVTVSTTGPGVAVSVVAPPAKEMPPVPAAVMFVPSSVVPAPDLAKLPFTLAALLRMRTSPPAPLAIVRLPPLVVVTPPSRSKSKPVSETPPAASVSRAPENVEAAALAVCVIETSEAEIEEALTFSASCTVRAPTRVPAPTAPPNWTVPPVPPWSVRPFDPDARPFTVEENVMFPPVAVGPTAVVSMVARALVRVTGPVRVTAPPRVWMMPPVRMSGPVMLIVASVCSPVSVLPEARMIWPAVFCTRSASRTATVPSAVMVPVTSSPPVLALPPITIRAATPF